MSIGLDVIPDTAQSVAYTAVAGNSASLPRGTTDVMVWCTTDARVRVGPGAVADVNDCPLPANVPVVLAIQQAMLTDNRVSAVQVTAAGTMHVQPIVGG